MVGALFVLEMKISSERNNSFLLLVLLASFQSKIVPPQLHFRATQLQFLARFGTKETGNFAQIRKKRWSSTDLARRLPDKAKNRLDFGRSELLLHFSMCRSVRKFRKPKVGEKYQKMAKNERFPRVSCDSNTVGGVTVLRKVHRGCCVDNLGLLYG